MASKSRREAVEYLKYLAFANETVNKAMNVFRQLPEGEPKRQMRELLRHYLYNNNYACTITPERPIEPEYKMLIRDDCNGDIYAVDKNFLSFHYRYALKNAGLEKHASEEYVKALDRNKAWSDMCEFPTYRSVEGAVLARLIEMQLPPNLIKAMKVNDFRDFVRNNCGEEFARYRERKSFIKTFINAWDVVVLDENGKRIEGPEFDRHHTIPVYSPNNVASLSEVNSFNKLCLIEKKFHRWLHKLEQAKVSDDMLYFEKIMVPEHAACILNFETYIAHDFSNPERRLFPMRPSGENLIYLNKLAEMTYKFSSLVPNAKREKTPDRFVHRGGKGSR